MSQKDMDQETYVRLFLLQKAADLGIHASLDAAATAANQMLRSLARKGQTVSVSDFATQMLQPEGLTAMDFENFARHNVIIQQLVQTIGSSGALITPQESGQPLPARASGTFVANHFFLRQQLSEVRQGHAGGAGAVLHELSG